MTTPQNWQKSSFSGGDGNNCVELASIPGTIHLRESDEPSIQLVTTPTSFSHLLRCVRLGRV